LYPNFPEDKVKSGMLTKVLYALISSSIAVGTAFTASHVVLDALPKGSVQEAAENFVLAPGELLVEKLEKRKDFKKLRKKGKKQLKKGKKQLEKAADALEDTLGDKIDKRELSRVKKLKKAYNVGSWAVVGFALSLLMTLLLGVSSLKSALALGIKVTLFMIFLQVALVFGGILAFQKLTS